MDGVVQALVKFLPADADDNEIFWLHGRRGEDRR